MVFMYTKKYALQYCFIYSSCTLLWDGRKNDGPNQDSNPDFLTPALDWFLIPPPQMIFALDYLSMLFSLAGVNQFQG